MLRRLAFIAPLIPAAGVAYAYMGRGSRNKFEYGGKMIPHPEKTAKGGEDAYYASKHVLAVADGVGGWNEVGVDPALYSRKLCKNIEGIIASNPTGLLKDPKTIITKAWMDNTEQGSSTLVVITLPEDEPRIYTSYVGDSGYCVLRPDNPLTPKTFSVLYASEPQQRRFNYPMQLGWGRNGDHPSIALTYSHDIQDGDIIIVGTDGLFDNISPKNISTVVSDFQDRKSVV